MCYKNIIIKVQKSKIFKKKSEAYYIHFVFFSLGLHWILTFDSAPLAPSDTPISTPQKSNPCHQIGGNPSAINLEAISRAGTHLLSCSNIGTRRAAISRSKSGTSESGTGAARRGVSAGSLCKHTCA